MKSAEAFLANLEMKPGADLGLDQAEKPSFGLLGDEHSKQADLSRQIEAKAVALLATREHGAKELQGKLLKKFPETPQLLAQYQMSEGDVASLVSDVVETCRINNWQSDERYLELAIRNYADKGQGPLKIRQKLQQCCADGNLISAYLDWDESDWVEIARQALIKKYGDCCKPTAQKEQAKRLRFLQSRGFTSGMVWKAFC